MADDNIIGPDDIELAKAHRYGEAPERVKRKLSPEMEKAVADSSSWSALARAAANSATFDQTDRLAAKMQGTPIEDQWEASQRIREAHPWMSIAGDVLGLGAQTAVTGGAGLIPRLAGAGIGRVAAREAINAGGQSLADNLIKTAEGREELSPGKVLAGAALGGAGGAAASQIPRIFGHAPSIAASVSSAPLTDAQLANTRAARNFAENYNFRGNTGLDIGQAARLSEDPTLTSLAAKAERIKENATPGYTAGREADLDRAGLRDMLDRSKPMYGSPSGPSAGGLRKHPDLSGKEVGQNRSNFAEEHVMTPGSPLPPAAQAALDSSYQSHVADWLVRNQASPNPQGAFGPTRPQPYERKMWEEVISKPDAKYPLSREDRIATQNIYADMNPSNRNRIIAEQKADNLERIKDAIDIAPAPRSMWPENIHVGGSVGRVPLLNKIPGLGGLHLGFDIPTGAFRPTERYSRAAELLRDPSFAELIGRLTKLQERAAGAGRGASQEPARSMSGKE